MCYMNLVLILTLRLARVCVCGCESRPVDAGDGMNNKDGGDVVWSQSELAVTSCQSVACLTCKRTSPRHVRRVR